MSGGSHDYLCYRIEEEFAGKMHDLELDDLMKDIATLTHDVEWYDSGDYGDETYFECVRKFKKKWFDISRQERLKGYIDDKLEVTKKELYTLIGVMKNGTYQ